MSEEFDPSIAYCINGDGRLAVGESILGIVPDGPDDFTEVVELICGECAAAKAAA